MRIRMHVQISGTRNGENWPGPGVEFDVPDDEGAELCANRLAEAVAKKPKVEKAVKPQRGVAKRG